MTLTSRRWTSKISTSMRFVVSILLSWKRVVFSGNQYSYEYVTFYLLSMINAYFNIVYKPFFFVQSYLQKKLHYSNFKFVLILIQLCFKRLPFISSFAIAVILTLICRKCQMTGNLHPPRNSQQSKAWVDADIPKKVCIIESKADNRALLIK